MADLSFLAIAVLNYGPGTFFAHKMPVATLRLFTTATITPNDCNMKAIPARISQKIANFTIESQTKWNSISEVPVLALRHAGISIM